MVLALISLVLWKAYIDFETEAIEEGESSRNNVRSLYDRLLERTSHVKVWIAYAHFEKNELDNEQPEDDEPREEKARRVYEKGYNSLKERGLKEEVGVFLTQQYSTDKRPESRPVGILEGV